MNLNADLVPFTQNSQIIAFIQKTQADLNVPMQKQMPSIRAVGFYLYFVEYCELFIVLIAAIREIVIHLIIM